MSTDEKEEPGESERALLQQRGGATLDDIIFKLGRGTARERDIVGRATARKCKTTVHFIRVAVAWEMTNLGGCSGQRTVSME